MKITDIIRLIRKHIILLLLVPAVLGTGVAFLTTDTYTSKTTLYTGMTSGTNLQQDQSFNYYTSNAAFDNLMKLIQSRETTQEVAIGLLAQHLMLSTYDPRYISLNSFLAIRKMTPSYINKLVVRHIYPKYESESEVRAKDTTKGAGSFSLTDTTTSIALKMLPPSIDRAAYKQTVKNLYIYMLHDDTNFVYRLLNLGNPHYSIKAISSVDVQRFNASDLIEMKYTSDDPGICQQTLALLTAVCMKNYKEIKENHSDMVVKYFEHKVKEAGANLKEAENSLLRFNEDNKIINYADQSHSVETSRENIESALQAKRIKLSGYDTAIRHLESKLAAQHELQQKNKVLIDKRNELADINAQLATQNSRAGASGTDPATAQLRNRAANLKSEMDRLIDELYNSRAALGTTPPGSLMETYLNNLKDYQETKEGISLLERKLVGAQRQYDSYAPAGVNLKRIERELSVAEAEYLEQVHGLNLAKLKVQDVELASMIKAVDSPYYPLSPNQSKRMLLVACAAILGLIIVLSVILVLEYFDGTLRNPQKAAKILNLDPIGIYPLIPPKVNSQNLPLITNRLLEMMIQELELYPKTKYAGNKPRTILFFSTQKEEGKTIVLMNLARKLKKQGKKVVVVNFSSESLIESELTQRGPIVGFPSLIEPELLPSHLEEPGEKKLNGHDVEENADGNVMIGKPETQQTTEEHLVLKVDESYYSISNALELLQKNQFNHSIVPDFILVELPPLLYFPYPSGLVATADVSVMVCRSNRSWSEADQGALTSFMKRTRSNPLFVLNGVEKQVVRSAIGNIPRKQMKIRNGMKTRAKIRSRKTA